MESLLPLFLALPSFRAAAVSRGNSLHRGDDHPAGLTRSRVNALRAAHADDSAPRPAPAKHRQGEARSALNRRTSGTEQSTTFVVDAYDKCRDIAPWPCVPAIFPRPTKAPSLGTPPSLRFAAPFTEFP